MALSGAKGHSGLCMALIRIVWVQRQKKITSNRSSKQSEQFYYRLLLLVVVVWHIPHYDIKQLKIWGSCIYERKIKVMKEREQ